MGQRKLTAEKLSRYVFRAVQLGFIAEDLWKVIVETPRGRQYYCEWRKDTEPTQEEMVEAWLNDRHAFQADRV